MYRETKEVLNPLVSGISFTGPVKAIIDDNLG